MNRDTIELRLEQLRSDKREIDVVRFALIKEIKTLVINLASKDLVGE